MKTDNRAIVRSTRAADYSCRRLGMFVGTPSHVITCLHWNALVSEYCIVSSCTVPIARLTKTARAAAGELGLKARARKRAAPR